MNTISVLLTSQTGRSRSKLFSAPTKPQTEQAINGLHWLQSSPALLWGLLQLLLFASFIFLQQLVSSFTVVLLLNSGCTVRKKISDANIAAVNFMRNKDNSQT